MQKVLVKCLYFILALPAGRELQNRLASSLSDFRENKALSYFSVNW